MFLDPDNGVGREGEKHATFSEIRLLRKAGRAIVFITFPGRMKHSLRLKQLHDQLSVETDAKNVVTLRTSVSVPAKRPGHYVPRARWFTVVDANAKMTARAQVKLGGRVAN